KAVEEHVRVGLKTRLLASLGQNFVSTAQSVAKLALLGWGVILVGQGSVTAGALMASMTLLGRAMGPVAQAAMLLGRLHQAKTAWTALQQLASAPLERPDTTECVQSSKRFTSFAMEEVSFAYGPEAPPAVTGLSLTIRAGERVGIIGGIGSGKSTILKLLLKLHEPQAGRVLVDGLAISGVDPARLRQDIGLIEQSPILFSGTIRMNLTMHCPEASNDTILAACERAGALSWIARLPRGFDTALGERGAGLSAGQKQSLAVARALVGEPSVLLMDEPTSDMDGRSEGEVLTKLKTVLPGKTLMLVTHRPALLELVDRLIVMEAGKVVADGPKAEVLDLLRKRSAATAPTPPAAAAQQAPAVEAVAPVKAASGRRAGKGASK
ncbi:MAG: ATP-binding cassette domain-containing protein, partial [Bosea sp. (in: a-proteobacteria)]